MKRIFASALAALTSIAALAATTTPVQLLNPSGSTAGQAIVSNGPSSAPMWGNVTATALAPVAANTVLANPTSGTAAPVAHPLPSCSTANSALKYASGTGISCGTTFALTTGNLGQFAATTSAQLAGVISDETGSGALVFGTSPTLNTPTISGGTTNNNVIGGTTPAAGTFTTLRGNSLAKVIADTPTAQSVANNTTTDVTNWAERLDTGNNFTPTTGVFTAPRAGQYMVTASIQFASATFAAGQEVTVIVAKNGTQHRTARFVMAAGVASIFNSPVVSAVIDLAVNDTVTIQAYQNSGGAVNTRSSDPNTFVTITELP